MSTCGKGYLGDIEECDDGNIEKNDGCSSKCIVEHGWSCEIDYYDYYYEESICFTTCGDGIHVLSEEVCDDGNKKNGDGCNK